jgi:putative copper export protein/mono/diheme cytochrome c family protein
MPLVLAVVWLVRWIGFLALAGLVGGFVVDLLVLPAATAEPAGARRRLRAVRVGATALLLLAAAADLWLRAATMSGGGASAALTVVPAVLARTHFGSVWIARAIGLLALLPLSVARSRGLLGLGALVALGQALAVSLVGHASDRGDLSLAVAVDWAHVVAATAWTGGLLALAGAVLPESARSPVPLLAAPMRRFSRLAACCLLVVALSGAYGAWLQLPAVSALWQTVYGRVLAVKVLFVVCLAGCGAINRYVVLPRLGARRRSGVLARLFRLGRLALLGPACRERAPRGAGLARHLTREALLGVVVFACTAALVESTPARHAAHLAHAAAGPAGPIRVTMEELHASGGTPRGWLFTPPPGDAARGRQVFARLGCFACHAVAGEDFPPSSGLGPDLTGAGEHHPAGYLLESVINPNAVIVEGPGYTGPDGRSIMPSYADRLSVGELLDLVAYLRSL